MRLVARKGNRAMTVIAVSPAMPAAEPPYLHLVAGIRVRPATVANGSWHRPLTATRFRFADFSWHH
jgi:hypothetical protein